MKITEKDIHEAIDRIRQAQDDEYWEDRFSDEDEGTERPDEAEMADIRYQQILDERE